MDPNSSGPPRMPKTYYSTYRQYKANERWILLWVHETVADIRAVAQPPPPTGANTTPNTPRGRAQKGRARNGGPKRTPATVDPDFASAKIPFRLFISLVEEIADSDVVIPLSYLTLLQLSIKQRKHIAAYYSPDADVSQTNKSHLHAIRAYTQAFEILKKAEESRLRKDVNGHLRQSPDDGEGNIFALSEAIYEASATLEEESINMPAPGGPTDNEWIRDNPMITSSARSIGKQKPKKPATFPLEEYELVPDEYVEPKAKKAQAPSQTDAFDALECFLVDVYAMRRYCNDIWKSVVPVGKTSHIAASFVTNKAVQLVKEMEYALLADFPVLKDMDECYNYLCKIIKAGLDSNSSKGDHKQKVFHSLSDQIMYHTFEGLTSFSEILKVRSYPVPTEGHYGSFDPLADRDSMEATERFAEDRCIMGNHWPDLLVASKIVGDLNGTQKLLGTQGLVQDFKEFDEAKPRRVSWALVFACQMHADSVLARRRHLAYDLSVMRNLGQTILKEYLMFANDGVRYDPFMDTTVRPFIEQSATEVHNSMEVDHITSIKLHSGWDKLNKEAVQKDALWLQNSWLTANVIAEASLDFYGAGLAVMGTGEFVQSTMQLWNMLKQTGYLPPRVSSTITAADSFAPKDHVLLFDHLIDVLGDKVFAGPPPKSNFIVNWEIMMGIRPEAFARGKRQLKKGAEWLRPYKGYGRRVEPTISDLYNMHLAKYFANHKTSTVSTAASDKNRRNGSGNAQKHPLAATLDLANSELGQPATLSPMTDSHEAFVPRGPLFNINFFKVHRLCVNLFTELEPALSPDIESFRGTPMDHSQERWPLLTGWIAMTETNAANGGLPNRRMLKKAADVVLKFAGDQELGSFLIREEGDESLIL